MVVKLTEKSYVKVSIRHPKISPVFLGTRFFARSKRKYELYLYVGSRKCVGSRALFILPGKLSIIVLSCQDWSRVFYQSPLRGRGVRWMLHYPPPSQGLKRRLVGPVLSTAGAAGFFLNHRVGHSQHSRGDRRSLSLPTLAHQSVYKGRYGGSGISYK